MSAHYFAYVLEDPRDGSVRYVGITTDPPERLSQHCYCQQGTRAKRDWISELKTLGLKPRMAIVQSMNKRERPEVVEDSWIRYYTTIGCDLTNDPSDIKRCVSEVELNDIAGFETRHLARSYSIQKGASSTKTVAVRIPVATEERLQAVIRSFKHDIIRKVSMSEIINLAISRYLDSLESGDPK